MVRTVMAGRYLMGPELLLLGEAAMHGGMFGAWEVFPQGRPRF
jgi:hypothetical protein